METQAKIFIFISLFLIINGCINQLPNPSEDKASATSSRTSISTENKDSANQMTFFITSVLLSAMLAHQSKTLNEAAIPKVLQEAQAKLKEQGIPAKEQGIPVPIELGKK